MRGRLGFSFCLGILFALPVQSHHSIPAHYTQERMTIEGVVTSFKLINPHARILLKVQGEDGAVERWLAEGESHGILVRRGWTGDELKPGDRIRITGQPARDRSRNMMQWSHVVKEDGTELGSQEPVLSSFDDLRRRQIQEREEGKD